MLGDKRVGPRVNISYGDASQTLQDPRPTIAHIRDKPLCQRYTVRRSFRRAPGNGANVARHSLERDVSQRAQYLFVGIETRLQASEELDDQDVAEAQRRVALLRPNHCRGSATSGRNICAGSG